MRRPAVAIVCLALGALAGCSEPEPSAPPEPEDSVAVTSDSAEPDDAASTSSPPDVRGEDPGVPELPPEATEDSVAGAEAFVRYYFALVNFVGRNPASGSLVPFGGPDCETCAGLERSLSELSAVGNKYEEDSLQIENLQAIKLEDGYRVDVDGLVPANKVLNDDEEVVATSAEIADSKLAVRLSYSDGAHLIDWIKNVED